MKTILIIEDEQDIADMLTFVLESEGYNVLSLYNADNYRQKVKDCRADVVLLDLNIAGFSGKLICEYIKGSSELKTTPVILMSANLNIAQIKQECRANDLIHKPFDIYHLVDLVNRYAS